jgi:hypothetical protein
MAFSKLLPFDAHNSAADSSATNAADEGVSKTVKLFFGWAPGKQGT